jgi:ligand-binding SRPBCC domain-containing protein
MTVIEFSTPITAPIERVFDLARSIDLHVVSSANTGEVAVGGVTTGLIEMNQEVTWRAKHLGVWQHLTGRITAFERPFHFRDSMVRGAFKSFDHDHRFELRDGITVMTDRFAFVSPLGPLGRLADLLFLKRYMTRFLLDRARVIKATAESEDWRRFLDSGAESCLDEGTSPRNRR